MESKGTILRGILSSNALVRAPGAYDALSAMLIEQAGFPVAYMSGGCVTHSLIGKPDIGYLSQDEMIRAVKNIVSAINIPLVADGDNGYGGPLQVMRTVEGYIRAGAAAIQMEDQVMPKRCGFMKGKELISKNDAVAKIRAAAHVRDTLDPGFVIIARTDAVAVYGIEDAIERANAYHEAGADMIYIEAPASKEMMDQIRKEVKCDWLMSVYVEGGVTPLLSTQELIDLGFKFVIHPPALFFVVAKAMQVMLKKFKEEDSVANCRDMMLDFNSANDVVRLNEIRALEKYFSLCD